MDDGKDDAQYFVTCTYCGTQTRLSLKQVERNEPLKCRTCGAPLEIVPPPKKRKKPGRDYGMLIGDGCEERMQEGLNKVMTVIGAIFLVLFLMAVLLPMRC